MSKKEKPITIKIDKDTQSELVDIDNMVRRLNSDMRLVCNTYVRAKGHTGKLFDLSADRSKLIEKVAKSD